MDFVKVGNVTINLGNVTHWVMVTPVQRRGSTKPAGSPPPADKESITLHFVSGMTLQLNPHDTHAFLKFSAATLNVKGA
jgi:hypothetical protein